MTITEQGIPEEIHYARRLGEHTLEVLIKDKSGNEHCFRIHAMAVLKGSAEEFEIAYDEAVEMELDGKLTRVWVSRAGAGASGTTGQKALEDALIQLVARLSEFDS
jgi:hypothetical protein